MLKTLAVILMKTPVGDFMKTQLYWRASRPVSKIELLNCGYSSLGTPETSLSGLNTLNVLSVERSGPDFPSSCSGNR